MAGSFGTAQRPWRNMWYVEGAIDLLPLGQFAYSNTRPATPAPPNAEQYFVLGSDTLPLEVANSLALVFYGMEREGESVVQEARVRVWAVSQAALNNMAPGAWMGVPLVDATLTLGTTEIQPYTNAVIPGGTATNPMRFVSDIIVTSDRSLTPPSARVVGQDATQGMCILLLDSIGAASVVVQITVKRADGSTGMLKCGVLYRTL